ncbi:MAG TPA: alcohol dehydrogenase catalytic domain-containing protein, partial [Kofleriaceae bacterium]
MKAWQLEKLGGALELRDVPVPEVRPGSVLVRVSRSALLSYQRDYIEGKLPHYSPPDGFFTIGTNAVGRIEAVGRDVWHLQKGQRVLVSPHFVARENVADPAQALIGLTAYGDGKKLQADWRDGLLAELMLAPAAVVTPV